MGSEQRNVTIVAQRRAHRRWSRRLADALRLAWAAGWLLLVPVAAAAGDLVGAAAQTAAEATVSAQQPDNAAAEHQRGRRLLALERPADAIPHLGRAAALEAGNAEYHFWLGVAWWAMLDFDRERESYLAALALDPEHLSARLYLAHNAMDRGDWRAAIAGYGEVLRREPRVPEALHNTALAEERLGNREAASSGWRRYFAADPHSPLALEAVRRLNARGDVSHRLWTIGRRKVVLPAVRFQPGGDRLADPDSREALRLAGELAAADRQLTLHVVVHAPRAALAQRRAASIRRMITESAPRLDPGRILLSWFGAPELLPAAGRTLRLDESVRFIGETASAPPS
jgi:tetratricopeptide (TPR) repeat protein